MNNKLFGILILIFCISINLYASPAAIFGTSLIADISEKASPAVVTIESIHYMRGRASSGDPVLDRVFGHLFNENFSGYNNVIPKKGTGSGVLISSQGHLLTNDHVIEGADEIFVTLSKGAKLKARLIGKDTRTDLAVLKIDSDDSLPYIPMGDSGILRVGEWVVAIGNPFGLGITVTTGVVSALNRDLSVDSTRSYKSLIQTDASINPGNSGGALLNPKGELIGINTAIIPYGQGIGFAIPINPVKRIVGDLIKFGRVKKPFLGVTVQKITTSLANYFNIPEQGVLVTDVVASSSAEKAGLMPGDVILEIDSKSVAGIENFRDSVVKHRVGEKVSIKVFRKGKEGNFDVVFNEIPEFQNPLGVAVKEISPKFVQKYYLFVDKGVVITEVYNGSVAYKAGLKAGDVIQSINDIPLDSFSDFESVTKKLSRNTRVSLRVVRRKTINLIRVLIN